MSTYYVTVDSIPANTPVKVLERDEHGQLLAEYKGYYNYKTDTITLYPAYNPFAANNGKLIKHKISSRFIKYS